MSPSRTLILGWNVNIKSRWRWKLLAEDSRQHGWLSLLRPWNRWQKQVRNQPAHNVIIIILHRSLAIPKTSQIAQSDVKLGWFYGNNCYFGEGRGRLQACVCTCPTPQVGGARQTQRKQREGFLSDIPASTTSVGATVVPLTQCHSSNPGWLFWIRLRSLTEPKAYWAIRRVVPACLGKQEAVSPPHRPEDGSKPRTNRNKCWERHRWACAYRRGPFPTVWPECTPQPRRMHMQRPARMHAHLFFSCVSGNFNHALKSSTSFLCLIFF